MIMIFRVIERLCRKTLLQLKMFANTTPNFKLHFNLKVKNNFIREMCTPLKNKQNHRFTTASNLRAAMAKVRR